MLWIQAILMAVLGWNYGAVVHRAFRQNDWRRFYPYTIGFIALCSLNGYIVFRN